MAGRHRCADECQAILVSAILYIHNRGLDARQWLAHGSRLHIHGGIVGDHDAAGLGLPPVIVKRLAKDTIAPDNRFRVQRFADASEKPERGEIPRARQIVARHHQQPDRGRGGIPDIHAFGFQQTIPGFGIELAGINQYRHAIGQRCDDTIGHASHPTGISRAPVDVAGLQVERETTGCMMGDNGFMSVQRTLRLAGGSAGEVEQGNVILAGFCNFEFCRGLGKQCGHIQRI